MYAKYLKRFLDICVSSVLLAILWPLLVVVAMLVRVNLGTPVLFCHPRPGRHGETFTLFKFRTMSEARSNDGTLLPDSDRLTRFGGFLRRTSLDELPELWNVLIGDMSLVGPRPLLIEYLDLYTEKQARRHEVRPGLTGLAQASGRNILEWNDRFLLDEEYVDNVSFRLDLAIAARTIKILFTGYGVSARGESTMKRFQG